MLTLYFVNIVAQSLPQIWSMETRDPVFRLSGTWLDLAKLGISGAIGIFTYWVALMEFPLDALEVGQVFVFVLCVQEDFWES